MSTIHKIFFDPTQPGLVYSVAAILKQIGDQEVSICIPAIPKNLTNEKSIDSLVYDIPVSGILENQGNNLIYLVGIGPKNPEEEIFMLDFIERHKGEMTLCLDNHSWSEEGWEKARQNCLMKKYSLASMDAMITLNYRDQIKIGWQIIEKALSSKKEAVVFENPTAKKYFLALEVSWIIDQRLGNDYYIRTFWNIVKEIIDEKNNPEISCLADLGMLMRREALEAINKISDDCPYFAESKALGRPVGYLKLGKVEEHTDITSILDEGVKKFPWLVIIDYSIKGKEFLSGDSSEININEILNYYFQMNISKEEVLKCVNAEIIRHVTA